MTAPFDPYHKWLGIPPKDQPPHHYRLLGIELLETDAEVIEAAANRLMAYLHEIASGDESGQSQKLLNEISAARICLLSKPRKAQYDAHLKMALQANCAAPPSGTVESGRLDTPQQRARSSRQDRDLDLTESLVTESHSRFTARRHPYLLGVAWSAIAGLCVIGVVTLLMRYVQPDDFAVQSASGPVAPAMPNMRSQKAMLELDWPPSERADATLEINGVRHEIPTGTVMEWSIGAGPLQVHITRSGYVEILWECVVARGERVRYSPVWEPSASAASLASQQPRQEKPELPSDTDRSRFKADNAQRDSARLSDVKLGDVKLGPAMGPDETLSTDSGGRAGGVIPSDRPPGTASDHAPPTLPRYLDIPAFDKQAASNWIVILSDVPHTPFDLQLIGGETIVNAIAFQLTIHHIDGFQAGWVVHHVDRSQQRTVVAEFGTADNSLQFRWHPDGGIPHVDQLRNCLLEIVAGGSRTIAALRSPKVVQPMLLGGATGFGRCAVDIESLPNVAQVRLELTHTAGRPSFATHFRTRSRRSGKKSPSMRVRANGDIRCKFICRSRPPAPVLAHSVSNTNCLIVHLAKPKRSGPAAIFPETFCGRSTSGNNG